MGKSSWKDLNVAVQLDPTDAPSPWVSPSQNSLVTRFFLGSCKTYSEPSGCIQECITILYYESQPKAWAEYRYKAKLIQGVWSVRFGPFWEGGVQNWVQECSKKGWAPLRCFEAWKRRIEGNLTPRIFFKDGGSGWGICFFIGGQDSVL